MRLEASVMSSSASPPPGPPPDVDAQAEFFLNHPQGRIFSAFFLGCVFMHGLHYLVSSSLVQNVVEKTGRVLGRALFSRRTQVDPELPSVRPATTYASKEDETQSLERYNDHTSLIFVLNLCFAFAGLAHFLSLPPFPNASAWETGCAFVVAWGGMAAQLGRLLGIVILASELGQIGVKSGEVWVIRVGAFAGLGFIFASNATNTGTTRWAQTAGVAFCYRKRFLPTILTSTAIRLTLELYLIVRLSVLSLRKNRWESNRTVKAVTLMRACSLLILDLLTIVPDVKAMGLIAEFLPFCLGAILVLATFNWKSSLATSHRRSTVQSMIFVQKPPGDASLMATPFTLHFPPEHRREVLSWASRPYLGSANSGSPARSSPHSHSRASPRTLSDLSDSVESAILATSSPAWRRSVKKMTLPWIPSSAPPEVAVFSTVPREPGLARKILPHQAAVAAQLEKEAGPYSPEHVEHVTGPVPPHMAGRQLTVAIRRDEESVISQELSQSPNSAVFGSDILQLTPTTRRADKAPDGGSMRSYRTSYESSAYTQMTHQTSEDGLRSAVSPRSSHTRSSTFSPRESLLRSTWRSFNRSSFASARSKSTRDDLPTVRETSPDLNPGTSRLSKHRSRRTTFGLAPPTPSRRARASTLSSSSSSAPFQVPETAPPMPAVVSMTNSTNPRQPPRLVIPVPTVQVLAPSNPGSAENSPAEADSTQLGLMSIKGPRAPPSAWAKGGSRSPSSLSLNRTDSGSPSVYSQETTTSSSRA